MKIKVGIIGSGTLDNIDSDIIDKAKELGRLISERDTQLLTGCDTGIPYEVVKEARKRGCTTIGVSPASNLEEHKTLYSLPTENYDIIIFTGFGYKGRNVVLIRSCDVVISISGGIGTLNEFTIAFDENKNIGVLEDTKGVSDYLKYIVEKIGKEHKAKLIFSKSPKELVDELL
jgi:hypothetical protein